MGRPGSRLNPATKTLLTSPAKRTSGTTVPDVSTWISAQQATATTMFVSGPTTATSALVPGLVAAVSKDVRPPHTVIVSSRTC
jgi:hypothetical protein